MIQDVDPARLRDLTLELVEIPSPTGDIFAVAEHYANRLEESGMEVELIRDFPATPIVVGRLTGGEPGPTVVPTGTSTRCRSSTTRLASRTKSSTAAAART